MTTLLSPDICIIGAGSAGLSVAAGAAQMGAKTVLIERAQMGGDCLNFGCVPSKSLIAAAAAAQAVRAAAGFGVVAGAPAVDFTRVHRHVHDVIAQIAPHDSQARMEGLGVTVIRDNARFVDADTVCAGDWRIRARRFVIAAGSSPMAPPVDGLDQVAYLTNESVFALTELPRHLIVLGGGPIGVELAQAFRRLGSAVTVLELRRLLGRDDPELAEVVRAALLGEGVVLREGVAISRVDATTAGVAVTVGDDGEQRIEGSHLLVAAGRTPNVAGLGLDAGGIRHSARGIDVDRRLRTSNRRVFAIGDVAGGLQFTHVAGHQAGIVLRNALFRWPARYDPGAIPRVSYTDPELAQVGMDEAQARQNHANVRVLRAPFADNDRSRAEQRTEGLVKIVATARGRILGAGIVGAHAGELIQPWVLALERGLPLRAMAGTVSPYPTLGEASKRAAGGFFADTLFAPRTRAVVRLLARLG